MLPGSKMPVLTSAEIAKVVGKASGVPAERVGEAERVRLDQLETRLAALIRAMDGAGETVVMVTLDCGEETTYAADTRTEKTSEDTRSSAASQRTHLLAGAQPVVQSVQAPQVRGVAVLCQGGGNAGTQRRITELVSALTGVGASHITVNKMQS